MKLDALDQVIEAALNEDIPEGDITSESVIPAGSVSEAIILAKEAGILAGMEAAARVFAKIDPKTRFEKFLKDGRAFRPHDTLARVRGNSISLLKGERTALNFLQRMSGIATRTDRFVQAVKGTGTKILDTRKTTPTLRFIEKYAVRMGGGENHRSSLSDMVLLKDNHLRLVGSITEAVRMARAKVKPETKIEVEVTNFEEAKEAVEAGASMIMLDNMSLKKMREVIAWVKGRVPVEVSGRVTLRRARQIASLGVDYISVGSLTHSFASVDISMEFIN